MRAGGVGSGCTWLGGESRVQGGGVLLTRWDAGKHFLPGLQGKVIVSLTFNQHDFTLIVGTAREGRRGSKRLTCVIKVTTKCCTTLGVPYVPT